MAEAEAPFRRDGTGGSGAGRRLGPAVARGREGAEHDFEDFFENGGIPSHIVGADGTILRGNRAELALLGYPEAEYVGRHIAEFHADRAAIDDILVRLARGERVERYPARLRTRDGGIRHVEITTSGRFHDGRLVSTRCFTIDVTELSHAREEIRRKDEALRQVLDALPAAVYTTDAAGRITYCNRAAVELAGREPEIGRDEWCVTWRLRTRDGAELPHDQCPMAIALKENREVRGVEALAQRPDGTLVPFLPFPTPLRDASGALVGAVNMLVDISERKEAEAHQRMLLDELNHRVKNNMQMLHGLLQAALRETGSDEARTVLGDASQRVRAMAAAQQLLYGDSNPRSFEAGRFLEAVCDCARQAFDRRVSFGIRHEGGRLSNDVAMPLALILNELLTNAVKHGIDGARGGIAVALRRSGGEVVLTVADEGTGFELRDGESRSSGLGLVRGLARQLGGTFSVEPGSTGARCTVSFPQAGGRC